MNDVSEDLMILYRAVCRKYGRSLEYAGCLTAQEAYRLTQLGLGKIVDVQTGEAPFNHHNPARKAIPGAIELPAAAAGSSPNHDVLLGSLGGVASFGEILMFLSPTSASSHAAATAAAKAGFFCVLNILDGRECFEKLVPVSDFFSRAQCSVHGRRQRPAPPAPVSMAKQRFR